MGDHFCQIFKSCRHWTHSCCHPDQIMQSLHLSNTLIDDVPCYILFKPQLAGGWEISHHPKVFRPPDGHLVDELYCVRA